MTNSFILLNTGSEKNTPQADERSFERQFASADEEQTGMNYVLLAGLHRTATGWGWCWLRCSISFDGTFLSDWVIIRDTDCLWLQKYWLSSMLQLLEYHTLGVFVNSRCDYTVLVDLLTGIFWLRHHYTSFPGNIFCTALFPDFRLHLFTFKTHWIQQHGPAEMLFGRSGIGLYWNTK